MLVGGTVNSISISSDQYDASGNVGYIIGAKYKRGKFFYWELGARYNAASFSFTEVSFDKAHEENLTYIMQRFMTIDGVTSSDPGYEAKKFYEQYEGQVNAIQKMIAALPVNLIINTSPDDTMVQALKQQGKYKTVHDWYNYEGELATDIELPPPRVRWCITSSDITKTQNP